MGKACHGPLAASERAGLAVLGDQASDLLPGGAADLDEHANHNPRSEVIEVHEGLHLPIMNRNPVRPQTHFMLERHAPFRLISYWKRLWLDLGV